MGNFEKLVVLTVLFVAAIVLAISFNRGGDEVEAANPLSAAQQAALPELERKIGAPSDAPAAQLPRALPGAELAEQEAPGTSLLLNAGTETKPTAPDAAPAAAGTNAPVGLTVEPESDPSRRILRDTNGLRPSFAEDYMVYTAVAGDTWSGLAQRFYQDGRYTRNLHQANDDLRELESGTSILVPVFDFLAEGAGPRSGGATLLSGAAARHAGPAAADLRPLSGVRPDGGQPGATEQEYVVQSGDTLSDISLAVFGTATRWKEIFDANRAVLTKPEWLQVGMKLKIPAGGRLPEAGAAAKKGDSRKPEAQPKTTAAAKSTATPPKKKVQ